MHSYRVLTFALILLSSAARSEAQDTVRQAVEFSAGYAGFVDEATIDHFTVGGAWRWQITRRLGLAPEFVFMRGPGGDRDVFVTGRLTVDAAPDARISPYLVTDGGLMLHRELVGTGPYWSKEGAASVGGGLRVNLTRTIYVAPEVRIGWEPHIRVGGIFGWRFTR